MKKKLIMSTVAMTVMLGFNRLAFADTINNNAVSYTHLDVYKRQ